jgi:hypothetical protein
MDKRYGILIVGVTILVLCFVGTASATTWSVDGSGGADFTGIQDAINNAKEGERCWDQGNLKQQHYYRQQCQKQR